MATAADTDFAKVDGSEGGWNRFWFTPGDALPLCVLRIVVGLAAAYFVASHSADLIRWFANDGILTPETVRELTEPSLSPDETVPRFFHWSYLKYFRGATELKIVHGLGLLVVLAFAAGLLTRVTSVAALGVVLSYIHRAPMLAGQFESILTMLIFYLCLAPAGASLSVDRLIFRRRGEPVGKTWGANVALRLMQMHVAAFYLIMGLTKLGGRFDAPYDAPWWRGDAMWWLITRTESRLVDLTFLYGQGPQQLVNAWTHAIVIYELLFAVLIWKRSVRPWLLIAGVFLWLGLLLVTGLVSFCLIMLVANLAFVSPEVLRRVLAKCNLAASTNGARPTPVSSSA